MGLSKRRHNKTASFTVSQTMCLEFQLQLKWVKRGPEHNHCRQEKMTESEPSLSIKRAKNQRVEKATDLLQFFVFVCVVFFSLFLFCRLNISLSGALRTPLLYSYV